MLPQRHLSPRGTYYNGQAFRPSERGQLIPPNLCPSLTLCSRVEPQVSFLLFPSTWTAASTPQNSLEAVMGRQTGRQSSWHCLDRLSVKGRVGRKLFPPWLESLGGSAHTNLGSSKLAQAAFPV